jgi:hypothetical protein
MRSLDLRTIPKIWERYSHESKDAAVYSAPLIIVVGHPTGRDVCSRLAEVIVNRDPRKIS